jgi:diguanylate cyclase (GGDEF)-like protein
MSYQTAYQPIRILVVDDDSVDRHAVVRTLGEGFAIAEAASGQQALAMLQDDPFDCILLDHTIPGTDTHQLLEEIGKVWAVVMLTGHDDAMVAVQAMKDGAQDFLVKGNLNREILHRAIANAIEKIALRKTIEKQRRELELLATTDGLTGLFNRRHFMARLEEEVARIHRFDIPLSLLMIDLDHFKAINDQHGHLIGDQVLVHIAGLLKTGGRGTDFVARYGGEEFCILALGANGEFAEMLANRLRELIANTPCPIKERESLAITCSIGVAAINGLGPDSSQFLKAADQALYLAKRSGRNRVIRAI